MPRGACTFRQRDLTKALKAAKDAGVPVARYEIDRAGTITIVTGKPAEPGELGEQVNKGTNEWDGVS